MADQESKKGDPKLEDTIDQMHSSDETRKLNAFRVVRKMTQAKNLPFQQLLDHGVVPLCVQFLDSEINELPYEAALILTNIASGTSAQTMEVVNADAVPKLVKLLQSNDSALADQSVWALGNIAGDGPITRDIVLKYGAVEAILELLKKEQPLAFLRNIVWVMSNFCRHKNPSPPFGKVEIMLPAIAKFLRHDDKQILSDAAWAISYATDADDEDDSIEAVIEVGCVPDLIRLLSRDETDIVHPVLRAICNIVSGTNEQVNVALEAGLLKHMKKFLNDSRPKIVENAAFVISNITAGNSGQIQAVLDAGLFEEIRHLMVNGDDRAKKEAAYAIANTSDSGTPEQVRYLFQRLAILEPFSELILSKDEQLGTIVRNGVYDFLKIGGPEILKHPDAGSYESDLSAQIKETKLK